MEHYHNQKLDLAESEEEPRMKDEPSDHSDEGPPSPNEEEEPAEPFHTTATYDPFWEDNDGDDYGGYDGGESGEIPSGTGYGGGDASEDSEERKSLVAQAKKEEIRMWQTWHADFKEFVESWNPKHRKWRLIRCKSSQASQQAHPSAELLDKLKQVLRCQTPDWHIQPQKTLYVRALQVCLILTKHFPSLWVLPPAATADSAAKDEYDPPLRALEELAQTSQLLLKQSERETKKEEVNGNVYQKLTLKWLRSQLLAEGEDGSREQDTALPAAVIKMWYTAKEAAAPFMSPHHASERNEMNTADLYRETLRPLAFNTVPEWEQPSHHFASTNKQQSRAHAPTKLKTASLWKELSTYPTALPVEYGSSVFVRAHEDAMDQLRVLIIGPQGTPYANGCFFFDVLLGDYPHQAPCVQFLTTRDVLRGGTAVRFNPNLYDCGKVCLSLLGTWNEGPGWESGESTLLQVLVSLQALVLGSEKPYFNEPGYEEGQGTTRGEAKAAGYNQRLRRETLRVALLPYLELYAGDKKQDVHYFAEFETVLRKHFQLKKTDIQKQIHEWAEEDSSAMMATLCRQISKFWGSKADVKI